MTWLGDYPEDFAAVTVIFTTHAASGAPVAPSSAFEAADLMIFKNGVDQKATANGITMTSPLVTTGLHCVVINTGVDTGDSGFWVAGAVYTVVLNPDETVDSVTARKVIGQFTLGMTAAAVWTSGTRTLTAIDESFTALNMDYTIGTAVPSAAANAAAVWDEDATAHQTSGSFGQTVGDSGAGGGMSIYQIVESGFGWVPSAGSIAAAVWDEDATAHQTTGTFGKAIGDPAADTNSIFKAVVTDATLATVGLDVAAITAAPTAAAVADAVWDEDATAHQTLGTFGKAIGDPGSDTETIYKAVVTDASAANVSLDLSTVAGQVTLVKSKTDQMAFSTANRVDAQVFGMQADTMTAAAAATDFGAEVADALLDRSNGVETGLTPRGALRLGASALAGKVSGAGTATETFRNAVADSKARITATVDSSGNRTAITTDVT